MAFREVTMLEVKEVVRQWLLGASLNRIVARTGLARGTVRRYVRAVESYGLQQGQGDEALTEDALVAIITTLGGKVRERGEAWLQCEQQRAFIETNLSKKVRLSKVRRLLTRHGVSLPYSTLYRFAVSELGFGRGEATMPVADGKPGDELQVDTGWMVHLGADGAKGRRFRAWIFTPCVSRYRFVWPCLEESTESAIEAFDEAWEFYGGAFRVVIPDNTKAIVNKAHPLEPIFNVTFLEYAQARGFVIDPARVRKARDKARVERSVRDVRDDCFGGEVVRDIEHARVMARRWCEAEYGMRRHSTTRRLPREHFDAVERAALLPPPPTRYDVPTWADPKVGKDHLAVVCDAVYSLPTRFREKKLRARADSQLVRFYESNRLVKTHVRQPRGGRAIDAKDFPQARAHFAMRDLEWFQNEARAQGDHVGRFAERLLEDVRPFWRMRAVSALLSLCRRYGKERVDEACTTALEVDMIDITRLQRIVANPPTKQEATPPARVIPIARYLRPTKAFAQRHTHQEKRT
jgi:hypothetical protein